MNRSKRERVQGVVGVLLSAGVQGGCLGAQEPPEAFRALGRPGTPSANAASCGFGTVSFFSRALSLLLSHCGAFYRSVFSASLSLSFLLSQLCFSCCPSTPPLSGLATLCLTVSGSVSGSAGPLLRSLQAEGRQRTDGGWSGAGDSS